jgi:nitrogen fixation protein
MTRLMVYVEDVQERHTIYNTRDVVHVDIPKPNLEDVILSNIDDGWGCKTRARRGQGTGRMKHLKDVPRK